MWEAQIGSAIEQEVWNTFSEKCQLIVRAWRASIHHVTTMGLQTVVTGGSPQKSSVAGAIRSTLRRAMLFVLSF